jgi:hypothetical protein
MFNASEVTFLSDEMKNKKDAERSAAARALWYRIPPLRYWMDSQSDIEWKAMRKTR